MRFNYKVGWTLAIFGGAIALAIEWHQWYGINNNMDNIAHFGAGLGMAMIYYTICDPQVYSQRVRDAIVVITVLASSSIWELYEIQKKGVNNLSLYGWEDTLLDISMAIIACFIILWIVRFYPTDEPRG